MPNLEPKNACTCETCQSYCLHAPGYFAPDQIDGLAARLHLTPRELFEQHLVADPWMGNVNDDLSSNAEFWVLKPATVRDTPGSEARFDPRGRCRWFTDEGRCAIHALGKPAECQAAHHAREPKKGNHEAFARAWDKPEHQQRIRELLGREPEAPEVDFIEGLMMLLGAPT